MFAIDLNITNIYNILSAWIKIRIFGIIHYPNAERKSKAGKRLFLILRLICLDMKPKLHKWFIL